MACEGWECEEWAMLGEEWQEAREAGEEYQLKPSRPGAQGSCPKARMSDALVPNMKKETS